jgi:pantoate--beta-alanine ligase
VAGRGALLPLTDTIGDSPGTGAAPGALGMQVFDTPAAMRAWTDAQREAGRVVGFVPTMGALHAGHLELVHDARRRSDVVVVSIFVNPLQFDVRDDFDRYPRPIDDDLEACRLEGVDAVYAPTAGAMYPAGFQTHVEPGELGEVLEGAHRPGHFRGVTTVVTKLFGAVRPHLAVFGQKDFQQLAIIRRMTRDLDLGVEIVAHPTVRERDGLAMSSRNRRLSAEQRAAAVCISRGLHAALDAFDRGERQAVALGRLACGPIDAEPLARREYLEVVDPHSLEPIDGHLDAGGLIVTAAWFGEVRLIDNCLLGTTPDL